MRTGLRLQHLLYLAALLICSVPMPGKAQDREYELKAGFIYNFARFSNISYELGEQYTICASDPLFVEAAQKLLKNKKIHGKAIGNRQVSLNKEMLQGCNTLFITETQMSGWQQKSELWQLKSIMMVGESKDFLSFGGHINFFLAGGKVRFEVNPSKLKSAGFHLSSKVLRLGRIYKEF